MTYLFPYFYFKLTERLLKEFEREDNHYQASLQKKQT